MVRPSKIETQEDIIAWIHDHDGRIDAWWEAQHDWNAKHEEEQKCLNKRMAGVERKLIWACGFASAAGSTVGLFAAFIFNLISS